jgi:CRP-like cAMP-binding protein
MFMVETGRAEVVRHENGVDSVVGELTPGDLFGEMAIFERQPRSATVRAKGRTRVLTLDQDGFMRRLHDDPSTAYRIVEGMSHRIRSLDTEVSRLKASRLAPPPPPSVRFALGTALRRIPDTLRSAARRLFSP